MVVVGIFMISVGGIKRTWPIDKVSFVNLFKSFIAWTVVLF